MPPRCRPTEAAGLLVQGNEDACLIYFDERHGVRLVGAAASPAPLNSAVQACIGHAAPVEVLQVVQTALPRIATYASADENARSPVLDHWPAASLVKPRHVLITPLEGDSAVCGALVVMRAAPERGPYTDFEQAVFRLVGFMLPARLQS